MSRTFRGLCVLLWLNGLVWGQAVTIGPAVFSGAGLNDATSGGAYVGVASNHSYIATIASTGTPDTVTFSRDGGTATASTAITGAAQRLSYSAGSVTAASCSLSRITYTDAGHPFSSGALASVTGASPSGYNVTNASVLVLSSTQFSVSVGSCPAAWTSGGTVVGNDGATITWAATTGHTAGDLWNVLTTASGSISTSTSVLPGVGGLVTRNAQDKLRDIFNVRDYGAKGNGTTDDTASIQNALNAAPSGTRVDMTNGNFKINSNLIFKSWQTLNIQAGATMTIFAVPFIVANVQYMGSTPSAPITLTTALQGTTTLTVSPTTVGLVAGRRIIVSTGTWTGSGTEEGPFEFNTIASITNSTQLEVQNALRYNYTAFGLPSESPRIYQMPVNYTHDVRITGGGTLIVDPAFNSAYGALKYTENIEIDHLTFVGMGNVLFTGGEISNLNFHDNKVIGVATPGSSSGYALFNIASVYDSHFTDNNFGLQEIFGSSAFNQNNHLTCEETCHDNFIEGNVFGPISNDSAGAVNFANVAFNNTVRANRIWGLDPDIVANHHTIGITMVGPSPSGSTTGNVVKDNIITNIFSGIIDFAPNTVIAGNVLTNDSFNAASIGVTTANTNTTIYGPNSINNYGFPYRTFSGMTAGFAQYSGTVDPTFPCTLGAVYYEVGGALGKTIWFCDTVAGSPAWAPRIGPSGTATVTPGPGLGTGGFCIPSTNFTDTAGQATCVTGTATAINSVIFTVTYSVTHTGGTACTFSSTNQNTAFIPISNGIPTWIVPGSTSVDLDIGTSAGSVPLTASTGYGWSYVCGN